MKSNFISIFLLFMCIFANQNPIVKQNVSNFLTTSTEHLIFKEQTIDDTVVTVALSFSNQLKFISPLHQPIVTKNYGTSIHLATFSEQNIYAIADGEVIRKGDDYIEIQHKNGYTSFYKNLTQISNKTEFLQGECIGKIAENENFINSSLYFEISLNGQNINPESVINFYEN